MILSTTKTAQNIPLILADKSFEFSGKNLLVGSRFTGRVWKPLPRPSCRARTAEQEDSNLIFLHLGYNISII